MIRRSLHIDKNQKIKFHSYNKKIKLKKYYIISKRTVTLQLGPHGFKTFVLTIFEWPLKTDSLNYYEKWRFQPCGHIVIQIITIVFIMSGTQMSKSRKTVHVVLVADIREYAVGIAQDTEKHKEKHFCGFSMCSNQYWAGRVYDLCVYYMMGLPKATGK